MLGFILGSPYSGKLPHGDNGGYIGSGFRAWALRFRVQGLGLGYEL